MKEKSNYDFTLPFIVASPMVDSLLGSSDETTKIWWEQYQKSLNTPHEVYAIKTKQGWLTTYTHPKGAPIPDDIKDEIIDLIGDEVDVFRNNCGSQPSQYCQSLCIEDGMCDHARPVRLAGVKKESLPSLTEEFFIKVHKYYNHLWRVDRLETSSDGTSKTVSYQPTLEEVKKRYGA